MAAMQPASPPLDALELVFRLPRSRVEVYAKIQVFQADYRYELRRLCLQGLQQPVKRLTSEMRLKSTVFLKDVNDAVQH